MQFRVLGPLEVERDGELVDVGPRKQREVLSLLLMHPGEVVTSERLLTAVWGEDRPTTENALWVTVSRLRTALEGAEGALVTRDHGYALDVDPASVDAVRFESLVDEARRRKEHDPGGARERLEEALALWRGEAWTDVAYRDFALAEVRRLEEMHVSAGEDLLELRLRAGQAAEVVAPLRSITTEHPLRERPVALLMLALHRSGRQAEALGVFADHARRLGEELGLEPSPGLCRLEEQILLHDPVVAGDRPFIGANPYKGLRAFREPDAGEYFGRDRVVAEVLRTIAAGETLITIVGGSGSGKTSLLRAGVLPAIAKGAVPGADQWLVATMVPGSHPFAELEAALLRASLDPPDSLAAQLEDDETGLLRASLRVLPGEDDRLLLVVDQLEELYTLADPIERARFLTGLVSACSDERGRVVVLTALRADFYPRALEHPEFGDRFDSGVVNIPSLRPDELEEAAVRPAELAGVTIEPPMLGALLADVSGRPGSLPLFQYLLTDLFDRCDGVLTLDAYRGAGGAAGALTRRAEEVYGALQPAEQEAVRQVFLRLVVPDEAGPATRRRLPAGELRSLGLDPAVLGSAIGALVSARLVTTDRDAVTDRPVVDVAHEALLTEWPRLREWIDAARDDLHRHAVLTAALDDWLGADEDPGYLWTGNRLIDYATWADSTDLALTEDEARFVAAGLDHAEADSATIAKQRRQQRRQLWGLVSAVVALLALAAFYLASLLAPGPPQVLLIDAPIGGAISDQLAVGLDDARRRLDVETDELRPEVDAMSQIDEALASEPDVVVVGLDAATYFPTYDWAAATERHPGTWFVDLSTAPLVPEHPRWVQVSFRNQEGAFLAGAVAAARSRSGNIGYVGAHPGLVDDFRAGYEAGAAHVDPSVQVLSAYTPTYLHPLENFLPRSAERSGAVAQELLDAGADVLFAAHGEGGVGVLRTVAADGTGWAIGVDSDQYLGLLDTEPAAAERVLASMVKRFDRAVSLAVEQALAELGGELAMTLENGGFAIVDTAGRLTEDEAAIVEASKTGIVAGRIEVPEWTSTAPTVVPAGAVEMSVVLDDAGSRLDQPADLVVGTTLVVSGRNDAGFPLGLAVGRPAPGVTADDLASAPSVRTPFERDLWEIRTAHNWTAVLPGGEGAISVVLDQPGTWAVGYTLLGDPFQPLGTWTTFEVTAGG